MRQRDLGVILRTRNSVFSPSSLETGPCDTDGGEVCPGREKDVGGDRRGSRSQE